MSDNPNGKIVALKPRQPGQVQTINGRTDAKGVTIVEKEQRALELRKSGASFTAIAETLGYADAAGASKAVKRALRKMLQEPAAELREIELARYDQMFFALWKRVLQGDLAAIDRALKIMSQRAQLLGLNAPVNVNLNRMVVEVANDLGLSLEEARELHQNVQVYLDRERHHAERT